MFLSHNLKTALVYVTGLSMFSIIAFTILDGWYNSHDKDHYIQKEKDLTLEISELEIHIQDFSNSLTQKEKELRIHEQLIVEKNLELSFRDREIHKWRGLYLELKQNRKSNESNAVVVSNLY